MRDDSRGGMSYVTESCRIRTLLRLSGSSNSCQYFTAESDAGVLTPPGPSSERNSSPVCWRQRYGRSLLEIVAPRSAVKSARNWKLLYRTVGLYEKSSVGSGGPMYIAVSLRTHEFV